VKTRGQRRTERQVRYWAGRIPSQPGQRRASALWDAARAAVCKVPAGQQKEAWARVCEALAASRTAVLAMTASDRSQFTVHRRRGTARVPTRAGATRARARDTA
jgi:hypothetical protein